MFRNNKVLSEKYFPVLQRLFGFEKNTKILDIDFHKPWWQVIWEQKIAVGLFITTETINTVFDTLLPFIVVWVLTTGDFGYIFWFGLAWVGIKILYNVGFYFVCLVEAQIIDSVAYQAVRYFLTVDPEAHFSRSSGKIIAKVNRGSESYEQVMDQVRDIIQVLAGMVTVVVSFVNLSSMLAIFAVSFFAVLLAISVGIKILITMLVAAPWIAADDEAKAANIETLQQVFHIRSSFATIEQERKVRKKNKELMYVTATGWYSHITADRIVQVLYTISIVILVYLVLGLTKSETISVSAGVSAVLVYFSGSSQINRVGRNVERMLERVSRIQDLFVFIRGFGKQTYPVLEHEKTNNYD